MLGFSAQRIYTRTMSVQLVGILNITPDSFSDGGQYTTPGKALVRAQELFADGASIVDIGAESTNPKKTEEALNSQQELERLLPLLRELLPLYPGKVSVDSYHPMTVEALVKEFGPVFIANDVTGMNNPAMRVVVAEHQLTCFVSHLPARFETDIQAAHKDASLDDIEVVKRELLARRQELLDLGLSADKIVLDPGIGFGKTMQLNWQLLEFAKQVPDIPVMIGHSRKRFLATDPTTGKPLESIDRFGAEANVAAAKIAINSGAAYLRVHDVAAHHNTL